MKQNELITKIMSKSPHTANSTTSLREVAGTFAEHSIHHLPVVDGQKLIGMIAYSDLLRLSFADAFNQDRKEVLAYLDETKKITDVMTKNVVTLKVKDTIKEAAKLLCQGQFHACCITEDNGDLAGIVTSTDVIKYLVDQY